MYKIRDWLYVSDYPSACSKRIRDEAGIQGMLQLFQAIDAEDVDCKYLPIGDGLQLQTSQIEEAIGFIKEQHAKNHCLLSTCGAGLSRSVMFAVIALKEIEGLSMDDAYRAIFEHHPNAMPDHVHWKTIADYYGEDDNFWKVWGDLSMGDL